MTKVIELKDTKRISYCDYEDTTEDSSFRLLEWEDCVWKKYVRDYHGTRWYGPYDTDEEADKNLYRELESAASKLGIDMRSLVNKLNGINVRTLVENVATKIETRKENGISVDVYKMDNGRVIHLKEDKY